MDTLLVLFINVFSQVAPKKGDNVLTPDVINQLRHIDFCTLELEPSG